MSAFDENPFADPSVQHASQANPGQSAASLDNYDPFSQQKTTTAAAGGGGDSVSGPAVMSPTQETDPPPPYNRSAQQTVTAADFQRRQEELERKAAELARREEELKASPYNVRANNWPPLPSFMPCQPCFYQDINVDIPVEFQETVKRLYYLWLLHTGLYLANLFGTLCELFGGLDDGSAFGVSLAYVIFFVPLSFLCWFRPAYKAFKADSSMWFMTFFLIFFAQFCFSVLMALGIRQMGACGLIVAISTFTGGSHRDSGPTGGDYFIGFMLILITTGWIVAPLADFFILTKIHGYYRATGASISKAQAEFTTNVFSNEAVRNAAASAAAAGVRQGFQAQQDQQAPRY